MRSQCQTVKIGVLSDTHDLLRPEVKAALQDCSVILHAGDISSRAVLSELQGLVQEVYAVRGNADESWGMDLPKSIDTTVCGLHVYMTHRKKDIPADISGYDLVVYGHSHKYDDRTEDGIRILNPGSCGPRRFVQPVTMAVIETDESGFSVQRLDLPHSGKEAGSVLKQGIDMRALVKKVMKETDKGHSIEQIAGKTGMEASLIEQIVRLYLTHPGVSEDGILGKMGI